MSALPAAPQQSDLVVKPSGGTRGWVSDLTAFLAAAFPLGTSGDWADYVPVRTGFGTTTLARARYTRVGKTVHASVALTLNGALSGTPLIGLPVPAAASYTQGTPLGTVLLTNGSSASRTAAIAAFNDSSSVFMVVDRASTSYTSGAGGTVSPTTPWTWSSGMTMGLELTYEAAS